jgi:hypothetical protein
VRRLLTGGLVAVLGAGLALALSLMLVGCGDDHTARPPGPLAAALAEIGGGGAHGSLGIGWTEPRLAREAGASPGLIAATLGPNAESVIEAAPAFRRRFDLDPLSARRLVSVGGSYAFGLRLEGVDAGRLRDALIRDGGRVRSSGGVELADVGGYAEVPQVLLHAGVLGLGARDAFSRSVTVLAISDTARDALLGRGDRLIDQPIYRAAAECLGDVVAARMIPDKLLLSTELGIELVAVGIERDREILCLLGGSAERARSVATALEASLAPDAREPRTNEPMADLVRPVKVGVETREGIDLVRAELRPAPGQSLGFLFDAIALGSLPEMIGRP